MNIAVIPARGGSKRIPGKNVRAFGGRPMLAWPIATALESGLFERVVVSTDDAAIAAVARDHGAEVPFMRPAGLADDQAGTVEAIAHAVGEMASQGCRPDYVCCIYPCAPFTRAADLAAALAEIETTGAAFVYPVVEYPHPTFRAMRRSPEGRMSFVFPECEDSNTQDLETTYHDAGQFYWGRAEAWRAHGKMHTDGIGMVFPAWRFVDIDTDDDWRWAEMLFESGLAEP